jgi:hypothetical protein
MATYTSTQELPVFQGAQHKQYLIIQASISGGGSVDIQFNNGGTWQSVLDTPYTANFTKNLYCAGVPVKIVTTGTVTYSVN